MTAAQRQCSIWNRLQTLKSDGAKSQLLATAGWGTLGKSFTSLSCSVLEWGLL